MVNDPHPQSLTAGQLKRALEDVPDGVVICLCIPAGGIGH